MYSFRERYFFHWGKGGGRFLGGRAVSRAVSGTFHKGIFNFIERKWLTIIESLNGTSGSPWCTNNHSIPISVSGITTDLNVVSKPPIRPIASQSQHQTRFLRQEFIREIVDINFSSLSESDWNPVYLKSDIWKVKDIKSKFMI